MARVIRKREVRRVGERMTEHLDYNPGAHVRKDESRQEQMVLGTMQRCGGGVRLIRKKVGRGE